MIKIEISFTTIAEAAAFLAGNNAPNASAVVAQTSSKPNTAGASTRSSKTQSESPEKTVSDATQGAGKAEQPDPASSPEQDGGPAADETPKVEYADLQKAVMALVAISTEEMKKIVDSFGIKTFKGSDASIWPAALKKINDRLAELKEGMA